MGHGLLTTGLLIETNSIKFIRYDNANITTTYKSTRKVMAWD